MLWVCLGPYLLVELLCVWVVDVCVGGFVDVGGVVVVVVFVGVDCVCGWGCWWWVGTTGQRSGGYRGCGWGVCI